MLDVSSGYSLDMYTTSQITSINSQVNEQANEGLQYTKGQIAYMKPENFMFHVKQVMQCIYLTEFEKQRTIMIFNHDHNILVL